MRHVVLFEASCVDLPQWQRNRENRRRGVWSASSSRVSAGKVCEADAWTATSEGSTPAVDVCLPKHAPPSLTLTRLACVRLRSKQAPW